MKRRSVWLLGMLVFMMGITAFSVTAEAAKVKVTSVKVQDPYSKKIEVAKGKSVKLVPVVTVTPDKKANKKVTFKSKNKKIATVNSKGVVKGKKAGKTKIVITSKKNKKKKATISVVVKKKAVKKVTLNQTSVTVQVGKALQLKATVTGKKGISKNVYWTSAHPSVATVSQSGVITPVAPGKTEITVMATDGSKKKATCTLNVVAAPVQDTTTSITALKAEYYDTLTFSLNRPYKLTLEDISVMVKSGPTSKYVYKLKPTGLVTLDHQNYTVQFYSSDYYYLQDYIKLEIPKLDGKVKSMETQFLLEPGSYIDSQVYTATVGKTTGISVYTSALMGYRTMQVSNLPAGLVFEQSSNSAYISGTPQKQGVYASTLTAQDEYGNSLKSNLTFLIGDSTHIAAMYENVDTWSGVTYTSIEQAIYVTGGSGSYKYSIQSSNGKFTVDNKGKVQGTVYAPGNYQVVVNVVDSNNSAISTQATLNICVRQSAIVSGVVRTLGGSIFSDAEYIYFWQGEKNSYDEETRSVYADGGMYSVALSPGKWNVEIYDSMDRIIYQCRDLNVTSQTEQLDFQVSLVKVEIAYPVFTDEEVVWRDSQGEILGYNNLIYVTPGTYQLTADKRSSSLLALFNDITLSFKADKKDLVVRAQMKPATVSVPVVTVGTHSVKIGKSETYWMKFVPTETATYSFYSAASQDTYGYLCDAEGAILHSADSGAATSGDFLIKYTLEAGKTYYLGAEYWYDYYEGTFNIVIEKNE